MHCASAGEFEQGKPVIENLKKQFPDVKVVVSFFSPSGFGIGKKYKYADHVTYLPLDTSRMQRLHPYRTTQTGSICKI
jgi:3-deoxy-D-manno-octulosonic-acid transferase